MMSRRLHRSADQTVETTSLPATPAVKSTPKTPPEKLMDVLYIRSLQLYASILSEWPASNVVNVCDNIRITCSCRIGLLRIS